MRTEVRESEEMMEFSDILARFGEKWCYYIPSVLLNMTLTGTVAILCVLILRLLMKKAPKSLTFLLWAVVLFRLLCPVSFALPVSLYSIFGTDIREEAVIEYIPTDIVYNPYPQVNLPLPEAVNDSINEELPYGAEQLGADPLEFAAAAFTAIWLLGALVMAAWNLAGYGMLLFRLRNSVKTENGIYETDCLDTAIVTGLFFHRIYVPAGLDSELRGCVIEHEKQHIRRRDPWFKFLFFAALCIHWYNPLVWIAFHIAVRDMEMACEGQLKDRVALRLPAVGNIVKANAFSNFAHTLGTLLANGVQVLQALNIVEDTVGNVHIARAIRDARDKVTDGSSISRPLAQNGVFPRLLTDMLAIGEESGDITGALDHIGLRYDAELDRAVKVFTTILEPVMMLFIAAGVGFVAISMLMAVFELTSGLQA